MKKKHRLFFAILIAISAVSSRAQEGLKRVEPPSWWAGMNDPKLQLLVQGENIGSSEVTVNYPGVHVEKVHVAENKNFIFIDLLIDKDTKAGNFTIEFQLSKKKKLTYSYKLNERTNNKLAFQGLDQRDAIYLLTPDRFVNGNPNNDEVKTLKEKKNRAFHGGRHGGDLDGVLSKLDYLNDLGITALWANPMQENDMPEYSYHGYAITDYYKIDARYGSNEEYKKLADELHKRKMKIIMDMVFNHCGREHWWIKDMPFSDWIHYYPEMINTNHAIASISDPHGATSDRVQLEKGWFVEQMPDLNHDNPFLATYLIQNSIWWIEYAGLDGIRMDTYPYNKREFMARWAQRVHKEYPNFFLVGETWVDNEAQESYWSSKGNNRQDEFNSHMNSMTDFPLCFSMHKAFTKEGDVNELYRVLSKDFLYSNSSVNKIFVDNHDMDRFFYTIDQDEKKFKMAMTFLLTTRGIPQIYYGTEINMIGHGNHGDIREDFPGGWPGDTRDAFISEGRTAKENESFNYLKNLLQWRRKSDAIQNGELKHFVPYDNLYIYNRKSNKESVVVIINNSAQPKKINTARYEEILKGYDGAVDIINHKKINDLHEIEIEGNSVMVLELSPELKVEK